MQNQNKYILFSEYLTLKNAYIILGNNYDKIKEENKNLKKILNEFQTNVAYFEETKNNIYLLSEEIKNKFNKKNSLEFNKNLNFQILASNSYENLLKNFKNLEEKYKILKEEQNKNILNKLGTNTYSTNTYSNKNDKNYVNNIINNNNNKNNFNNIIENFVNNFEKNEFEPVPTFLKCLNKLKY